MSWFDIAKLQKAQQDNLALVQGLGTSLLAGAEKLGQLQLKALTDLSAAQFDYTGKLLAVRDPKALAELNHAAFGPSALLERQLGFNRDLFALLADAQQQLGNYGEQQWAAGSKQVDEWVEQFASHAPAGSEPAVSALKQAVSQANEAREGAQKAAKDAADIADKVIKQATEQSEKAARQVAEATEKGISAVAAAAANNPAAKSNGRGAAKAN
ncbi:phasin family protein [Oceanimonas sp. CHS3-5]|uniref:phasin family protein n=1 Tax=Oceanimonas sp. CHS3-5 TaxID=3068186 RepID=UPI00273DF29B|nr:phasin family protein [Oceanimonas sp. CHS3-5]MDP5292895.1 phasin family protein [Oceanimonas sp. CHS3-5]